MEPKTELQKNAIALARKQELEINQRAYDMEWLNNRMEDGRMGRLLALIQREADMEKDFQERTDHAALVNSRATKEAALALEISEVRREEQCKYQRRRYLRERDPGLRELQKKLASGYNCRDIQQQILHNQYKKLQEKADEKHANDLLQAALFSDLEQLKINEQRKIEDDFKYRQEVQQQLVNRQRQRQCQYEESLIEKKMLDDILRTISYEDKRELEQKRMLVERTCKEMVTFQQARLAWRDKQKHMVIAEEKEIEKQAKEQSDRSASVIAERERKLREREESNARMAAKVLAAEEKRQERMDIIKQLQEQEFFEQNVQHDIAEKEKQERVKKEVLASLNAQVQYKKDDAEKQKRREIEFRKETERKIKEDEEKERIKKEEAHRKKIQYAKELRQLAELGARKKEFFKQQEEERAKAVWDYNKAWDAELEHERKKIIREHAPHILGYLQPGVLKKEDLPAVKDGANKHEHLAKLDIEKMAASKRPKQFSKCNAQCRILREF